MTPERQAKRDANVKKNFWAVRPTKQPRVLLADDDPDILEILKMSLQQEGYKIQTATDGLEVLQKLDEFGPDVLCIDYMMPHMDGQEVARQIRARQDLLYIPIVMLTAAASQREVKLSSLDSGVDAFLAKPVSREELRVTIRTLLRMKTAQDNMLEALERVAEVQDELLRYERQQGQAEAAETVLAAHLPDLAEPLKEAVVGINRLEKLWEEAQAGGGRVEPGQVAAVSQAYLKKVRENLSQLEASLQRLNGFH